MIYNKEYKLKMSQLLLLTFIMYNVLLINSNVIDNELVTHKKVNINSESELYYITYNECNHIFCYLNMNNTTSNLIVNEDTISCISTRMNCGKDYYNKKYNKIKILSKNELKGVYLDDNIYLKE